MKDLTPEQLKEMMDISYMFKKKKERNDQPERLLQRKICNHLQEYYPDVYFMSDPSGIKLSPNILKLLKSTRSAHSQLDICIMEPSREFKGLFIEVKASTPYQKNGELFTDPHLEDQHLVMQVLRSKGYQCLFCWSLDQAIIIFDIYLGKPVQDNSPLFP